MQDSGETYFHVKGKERSERSPASSVQLPFDVPITPYSKDGKLFKLFTVEIVRDV